jgi:hypothetical protein
MGIHIRDAHSGTRGSASLPTIRAIPNKLPLRNAEEGNVGENLMKKQNARITIPVNPTRLILLAVAIKAQHEKLEKNSPLVVLDWEKNGPPIEEASAVDTKLAALEREVEKLAARRKVLLDGSLVEFVRSCRDVLSGAYRGELHQMVDFGFEVEATPRSSKSAEAAEKKVA